MLETLWITAVATVMMSITSQDATRDLLQLESASGNAAVPSGWIVRAVRNQKAPSFSLIDSGGVRFLRIRGVNRAAWFVRELTSPLAPTPGSLTWSWRAPESPRGADLRAEATDDAALRVFVVFERKGWFERTPRTLFYTSGTIEPEHYARPSYQSSNLHVIRMSGATNPHEWVRTEVDPYADYRRVWGGEPRRIEAVGFMQDTEQTQSAAIADVRAFFWTGKDSQIR